MLGAHCERRSLSDSNPLHYAKISPDFRRKRSFKVTLTTSYTAAGIDVLKEERVAICQAASRSGFHLPHNLVLLNLTTTRLPIADIILTRHKRSRENVEILTA